MPSRTTFFDMAHTRSTGVLHEGGEYPRVVTWPVYLEHKLRQPSDVRIWAIAQALSGEMTVDEVHEITKIDTWYLDRLQRMLRNLT